MEAQLGPAPPDGGRIFSLFLFFFILNNINSVSFPISSFSDEYFTTYLFSHYDKMFLNIFKIFCIECDC